MFEDFLRIAKSEGIERFSIGAVVIHNEKFLLLKRPLKEFMGGVYELPSGKMEKEEKIASALGRELREETNLRLKRVIKHVGNFDYVSKSGKRTRQFNFFVEIYLPINIKLTEHENYIWISKESIENYHMTKEVKEILFRALIQKS